MKRILFIIVIILGVLSCGVPNNISILDKNLDYKDEALLYKEKPYTGKINLKESEKDERFETGHLALKNGHLDGKSEFKNEKEKMEVKFTVKDGKFDNEYTIKHPLIGDFIITYDNGVIVALKGKTPNEINLDITFDKDGNINGIMGEGSTKIEFKDGVSDLEIYKVKMYLDNETKQVLITEVYEGERMMDQEQAILLFTIKDLEDGIFSTLKK